MSRLMQLLSERREPLALTKPDFIAAVDAIDQWVEDNAVSYNQALPQPARSALTAAQKAELLSIIAQARYAG